jgi:hypothetical protein
MAMLLIASSAAEAQQNSVVASSADSVGPASLAVGGTLRYNVRYSETAGLGGALGGQQQSYASADAGYTNQSKQLPFNMQYGGGFGWVWSGPSEPGNVFQHLSVSQGFAWRAWNLSAGDNVSYSFETPTTGFSGVPGTGEAIGGTGSTTPPNQTVLTVNTRTLNNSSTAAAGRRLDYATTLNFGGSVGELLYIDNNGQNTDSLAVEAGISRRLNARTSASGEYSFSRYYFGDAATSQTGAAQISYSQVNSLQISFKRQWTRKISVAGSVGPQWISSSNSAIQPSSTRFSASASVQQVFKIGGAGLNYNHGVSSGSGIVQGAENDTVSVNYARGFGRSLNVGLTGSYMRTAGLNSNSAIHSEYGEIQATRGLGRYFNVFANYTVMNQSGGLSTASNVLNSLTQVIGFGIGYSPREIHFKK